MRRASIGRLRIIRCPIRYPARTVKQWVSVKCSASCSHSDFCCLLSAAVRRWWCSPGDFMRTAVVLSRPSSVRWTRLLQTNVDVIPFFFSFYNELLDFMPLVMGPAARAVRPFVILVTFPRGERSTTAKVAYIWKENGYIFSGTIHNWCARPHPLHLSPLSAVMQPALSVCYSSVVQTSPLFFFSFFIFLLRPGVMHQN